MPGGFTRGGHAYKEQEEVIIALSGAFDVIVHNGREEHKYTLNRSYFGLYIPPLTWRRMENFSTNALSLHLSSSKYDESDYVREFESFLGQLGND